MDDQISGEILLKLEKDAEMVMGHQGSKKQYMLVEPNHIKFLVDKIKELQIYKQYLEDWADYDIAESNKFSDFISEMRELLYWDNDDGEIKNCHKVILDRVRELVGKIKRLEIK